MEKVQYRGWPTCYRLANEVIELIATGDVGPRIIRFGFTGQGNEFKEFEEMMGLTDGDQWRIYGGHRLWHAPESMPRTYTPDNDPVAVSEQAGVVRIVPPVETTTGLQKEIDLTLSPSEAHVRVVHRLRNAGAWTIKAAPWALSVMAPGGTAILPVPQTGDGLLPTSAIGLWPYTRMTDPRWTWGDRYILLAQTPGAQTRQKTGVYSTDGWAAYARNGHCFVKRFHVQPGAEYPDFGATVETYTDGEMLELETLGPLTHLEPGSAMEHVEDWHLLADVPEIKTEQDVDQHVLPRVQGLKVS